MIALRRIKVLKVLELGIFTKVVPWHQTLHSLKAKLLPLK